MIAFSPARRSAAANACAASVSGVRDGYERVQRHYPRAAMSMARG